MSERRPKFDLYRRHGLSIDALRSAIQADPELRAEAEAELEAVAYFAAGAPGDGRCAVSRDYAEILRKALT